MQQFQIPTNGQYSGRLAAKRAACCADYGLKFTQGEVIQDSNDVIGSAAQF